jgi:hypothetical protein
MFCNESPKPTSLNDYIPAHFNLNNTLYYKHTLKIDIFYPDYSIQKFKIIKTTYLMLY